MENYVRTGVPGTHTIYVMGRSVLGNSPVTWKTALLSIAHAIRINLIVAWNAPFLPPSAERESISPNCSIDWCYGMKMHDSDGPSLLWMPLAWMQCRKKIYAHNSLPEQYRCGLWVIRLASYTTHFGSSTGLLLLIHTKDLVYFCYCHILHT